MNLHWVEINSDSNALSDRVDSSNSEPTQQKPWIVNLSQVVIPQNQNDSNIDSDSDGDDTGLENSEQPVRNNFDHAENPAPRLKVMMSSYAVLQEKVVHNLD